MRNLTNNNDFVHSRDITNGGSLNALEADLPLNLVLDDSTNNVLNLGGLHSYGEIGQVMKVNTDQNVWEYADETDTTYLELEMFSLIKQWF